MDEERRAPAPADIGARTEPAAADRPELPSLPVRLAQVFFSPGDLFERLRERPAWVGALLVIVALNVAATLAMPEELFRQMLAERMPPDADPRQLEGALGVARVWGAAVALLGPPIVIAVLAGAVLLVYNVLLGGEATFRQLYSASAHAFFISVVGGVLVLGLMIARGDPDVALSLHLLAPGLEEGTYPFRLLRGLHVFGLWTAVVLGIAVGRIYPRRSGGSAALLLVGLYVAFKAVLAAFRVPMA